MEAPSQKDKRAHHIKLAKALVLSKEILVFKDLIAYIPKYHFAKALKKDSKRMKLLFEDPKELSIFELEHIANYLEIDIHFLLGTVLAQYHKDPMENATGH